MINVDVLLETDNLICQYPSSNIFPEALLIKQIIYPLCLANLC